MARSPAVADCLLGALLCLSTGCSQQDAPVEESEPTDWQADLARLDQTVTASTAHADAMPSAWTRRANLASALAERAHHRGSLDDYAASQQALKAAFSEATPGIGPWMAQARLDGSLHRFDAAETAAHKVLNGAVVKAPLRAEALGLLGRIALERQDLELATELLTEAHELDPKPAAWANLAILEQATGDPAAADAHWRAASSACNCAGTRFDGWVQLQRGLVFLDADQPERALPFFAEASKRYSGDWVFQEHHAEALAATGQLAEADALYATAVATVRDPEILGAWGGLKLQLGDDAQAQALIDEARTGFEAAMDRFPEAAAGHAVDFFAEHGPPERALQAAQIDASVRPTPDRLERLKALETP